MSTRDALQAIYDEHQQLTPELVVTTAADPDHELHERFEWDDTEAARRFRLTQAQGLIRSVKITVVPTPERPPLHVRAFVSDREVAGEDDPWHVGRYRPVREVVASDTCRTAWLRTLEREWKALRAKAGASREFAEMVLRDLGEEAA